MIRYSCYLRSNFDSSIRLPIAWCKYLTLTFNREIEIINVFVSISLLLISGAPECLLYARFTNASDVWAFATTLWEMFSYGRQPWEGLTSPEVYIYIVCLCIL